MELWDKMLNFKDNIGLTYQYSENSGQNVEPKYGSGIDPPILN